MTYISDVLFWISTGLLVPVVVLLLVLFGRSLLLIGTFFGQYMNMRRVQTAATAELEGLTMANVDTLADRLPHRASS